MDEALQPTAEVSEQPRNPPTSGAAIAALVFAVLGLLGPLYLVGPLLALGFARRARREVAYGALGGGEVARAARILAWTSLVLLVVAGLVVAGFATVRYETGVGFRFR